MIQRRSVDVISVVNDVTMLDMDGNEILLGAIEREDYGNDEARRFRFHVEEQNPFAPANKMKVPYVLGIGSSHMNFINPAEAQRALVEMGYTATQQFALKGGAVMKTLYFHPEKSQADVYHHDAQFWNWRNLTEEMDGKLFHAVLMETDLRIGHMALRLSPGWFRSRCTNGLFSSHLVSPVSFRHLDFEKDHLGEAIRQTLHTRAFTRGKPIGQIQHVYKARNILHRYADEMAHGEVSSAMQLLAEQFQGISPNRLKPWALKGYTKQLDMHIAKAEDKIVHVADLVNAYTNAVNDARLRSGDRGIFDALESTDAVVNTTIALSQIAQLF